MGILKSLLICATFFWVKGCVHPQKKDCKYIVSELYDQYQSEKVGQDIKERIKDAIHLNQDCAGIYLLWGDILINEDSLIAAKNVFLKAQGFDQGKEYAEYKLGIIYYMLDSNKKAAEYFESALMAKSKIGNYYFESANDDFTPQFTISVAELTYNIGLASYYNRELSKAKSKFLHCIDLNYNKKESNFYVGIILIEQNRIKEGCRYLEEALIYGYSEADNYIKKYCEQ